MELELALFFCHSFSLSNNVPWKDGLMNLPKFTRFIFWTQFPLSWNPLIYIYGNMDPVASVTTYNMRSLSVDGKMGLSTSLSHSPPFFAYLVIMAIWVVKFLREGYKLRSMFGQKSSYSKKSIVRILKIDIVPHC